ncbi:DNA methylase [Yersinia kristensenii]|nr:DNA methylase [Yersinia kristensenii]
MKGKNLDDSNLGSKAASGAYQAIIALMPPHDTYIELFLGTGAVMMRKPPAIRSIGVDINPLVISNAKSNFPGAELHNTDAINLLENFDFSTTGRTLIYCDPPYLHETRTSQKRYAYEYSDSDHRRLLTMLESLAREDIKIILSGYPNSLYNQLLPDWESREFQVMTRGGVRTEKLWFSFLPDTAHWATFAGTNFTDRQRIKRMAERWGKRYKNLTPGEQVAVLAAMLAGKDT